MGDMEHHADPPVAESMGPIQMTSLAFPGNHFKGEILPELEKLKTGRHRAHRRPAARAQGLSSAT